MTLCPISLKKVWKRLNTFPSSTKFKFGDGRQVTVIKCNVFPAVIAGKHCKINAEILKENIVIIEQIITWKMSGSNRYDYW